jgi:uncharacterized protein YeaO (DUF488 family)
VIEHASIYDDVPAAGSLRVLIMRLWPRGVKRERVDLWLKDAAPSRELLAAYAHQDLPWSNFEQRYRAEILDDRPSVLDQLRELERQHGRLTLLCTERIPPREHCHRLVLVDLLRAHSLGDPEYELLTSAYEDLHGLWEAIWGLRTLHGGSGEDELLRLEAEPILRSFLEWGWIELQRAQTTIDPDQARRLLSDPSMWLPPVSVGAPYVGFVATRSGDDAWNAASAVRNPR